MGDISTSTLPPFTFTNTIAGKPRTSQSTHHGVNPVDKSLLWDVPIATDDDVEEAIAAAREAFKSWSQKKWTERQSYLRAMKEEIAKHREELTKILMLEGGKPYPVANGEVFASEICLDYHATVAEPVPEILQDDDSLKLTLTWVPLGVSAAICPWNFPLILSMGKICSALVTGNTCIVKPSPFTPYSALYFVSIVSHLLPPGVLTGLNGDDHLGPKLTLHPSISKISFTGSIPTGKRVMASCASTLKRCTLELGGNSACIVCPDVDLDKVAPLVAMSAFYNSGQLCVAAKRIYVHESIYPEFRKKLVEVIKSWKVGGVEGATIGPVQNAMQYEIVKGFFEDCAVHGYEFALGGEFPAGKNADGGYVVKPALVDNPPDNSRIVKEEPFGPIAPLLTYSDTASLLARVNATNTGLSGTIYSASHANAEALASQIEAGTIWINSPERPLAHAYFSGHKESGLGGESGEYGLKSYLNARVVHLYKGMDVGKAKTNGEKVNGHVNGHVNGEKVNGESEVQASL